MAARAKDRLCPTSDHARDRIGADQAARFTPIVPDVTIGREVKLDGLVAIPGTIVPMPGHTPGSLIVIIPGGAIVGDLFRGAIVGSSAEVHFYMCDLEDNRTDVRALLARLVTKTSLFFTGHFGPVSREAVTERFAGP